VFVSADAADNIGFDPGHNVDDTLLEQLNGCDGGNSMCTLYPVPPMSGFVRSAQFTTGQESSARDVMKCFNQTSVPVLSQLALEYALFDSWFSSVPGPTQPNRLYSLSATSDGDCQNANWSRTILGYPQRAITDDFAEAGLDWKVYFGDFPLSAYLNAIRKHPFNFACLDAFMEDAEHGRLPAFSIVEPRYMNLLCWEETDQHPYGPTLGYKGDVTPGELFMNQVYEALINSPQWNETALVIYYDEHGGLYDHVPPPVNVPNPDGKICSEFHQFDFTRLGVRVPAVVISPWVTKGSVVHAPSVGSGYDHTSLLSTMRKIFNLRSQPLTPREGWAPSFESLFLSQSQPRTDYPRTLLNTPELRASYAKYLKNEAVPHTLADIVARKDLKQAEKTSRPLTHLQEEIVELAALMGETEEERSKFRAQAKSIKTEVQGALFVRKITEQFLKRGQTQQRQ
jgi:phospholipase C